MTDPIQMQGPKQAKRDKYFALLGIGQLTDAQTRKMQDLARSIIKADVKQGKADAKVEAKGEKARILYLARLERCRLARADLEDKLPVTARMVGDFDTALAAAARLEATGKYAEAAAKLDEVSATHAPEAGRKLWNEAAQAALKKSPAAFQDLTKIDKLLADPASRLTRDAIAVARRQKLDFGRSLLAPAATASDMYAAATNLAALHTSIQNQITTAQQAWTAISTQRDQTSDALDAIAPLSGDVVALLTDRESAPLRLQLASADTSIGVCDFATARTVLDALQLEIDDIDAQVGPLRDQWLQSAPGLDDLLKTARELSTEAAAPQFKKEADVLAAKLSELFTLGPGKSLNLAEAVNFVEGAGAELKAVADQQSAWLLYQRKASGPVAPDANGVPPRTLAAAQKSIDSRFKEIDLALRKIKDGVDVATAGRNTPVVDARWVARRDAAARKWTERCQLARDPASLDEAGMDAELVALCQEINRTRSDPVLLQGAIDEGRLAQAKASFFAARDKAQAACDALVAVDAVAGGQEQITIDGICAPALQPGGTVAPADLIIAYETATGSLNAKARRVDKRTQRRDVDIIPVQQELKQKLDALQVELAKVKALADGAKTAAKQAPLVALLDTLQTSLDGLRAMAGLTQLKLLKETLAEVDTFTQTVAQSINAARGESNDDAMSFDKARKTIAKLKDDLADKKSRQFMIDTQDRYTEQVKTLEKGLGTTTMAEMTTRLGELTAAVKKMKEDARVAQAETETFEKTTVAALLKTLENKAYDDAPAYRKTMKEEIKGLVAAHSFEGGKDGAQAKAADLSQRLAAVLQGAKDARGVPQLLADEQENREKADNAKIVEQGKWEGESKVLAKQLDAMKGLNPREVKPLLDLLDSARTSVEKSKDHAGGRAQLQTIRNRMSLIAANPKGLAITARNRLPQVGARVKKAIAAYMAALTALDSSVQAMGTLDAAAKRAVSDRLTSLQGLFNPVVFDEVVAVMSAKGNTREHRSGERERGLREVRRMQGYLDNDIRLRTLAGTPFHKAMPSVLSELTLSLLDIENNMLVSI